MQQVRQISIGEYAKEEGMYLRRIIRRNKGDLLTNSEVKVLVAMVNLWLHHRNGPKGYIHPGCDLLAKKTKVSRKTVSRALDLFRKMGIAIAVRNIKGGNGRATQYKLDLLELQSLFDPSNVVNTPGELVQFSGTFSGRNVPQQPGQNVPLSIGKVQPPLSSIGTDFGGGSDE